MQLLLKTHPDKTKTVILIVSLVIMISVLLVRYDDFRTVRSGEIANTDYDQLDSGSVVTQKIHCENDGLDAIYLYLGTFVRMNHCNVTAVLMQDQQQLCRWDINAELVLDNSYYILKLDDTLKSKGQEYSLVLASDGSGENAIAYYKNTSGEYSGLSVNGTLLEGESLCYELEFKTGVRPAMKGYLLRFLFGVLLGVIIAFIAGRKEDPRMEVFFLYLWIPLSVLYLLSNPLFNVNDECNHFCRAFELSLGYPVSEYDSEIVAGGRELPLDCDLTTFIGSWEAFEEHKGQELTDVWVFKDFTNTALYAPVSYIPQTVGILFGRLLSHNVVFIAYMGRLINWLCATLLFFASIKVAPYGKKVIILIAFMPRVLSLAVSLAPDSMVIALTVFIIAYVMYLRNEQKTVLTVKQYMVLYIASLAIAHYKIVYLPFVMLLILIPKERFRGGLREKIIHAVFIGLLVSITGFVWIELCNKFLVIGGTDSRKQLMNILQHPVQYYLVIIRTTIINGAADTMAMVGSLMGWKRGKTDTGDIFAMVYLFCLMYGFIHFRKGIEEKSDKDKLCRWVNGIVLAVVFVLIYTSLYLQWTQLYSNVIIGLQGRYYIPLILPLYYVVNPYVVTTGQYNEGGVDFGMVSFIVVINICICSAVFFHCLGS